MRYKKELLQLNVEKFTLEDVVDFDATHDKWEFLKFDSFNWNNHLEAQEKKLVTENDSVIYYEHSSSIEKEISTVARIFSISLNQCFIRKTLLEQLQFNSLKYESVLNSLHFVITQYEAAIKELQVEMKNQSAQGHEYDDQNSALNALRDSMDKSKQNFFHGLENHETAYTRMITYLQEVKEETEKYHSALQQAIELTDVRLQTEIEIKDRAQEKMHSMRKEYLHSVTHYGRFGSTVAEGEENEDTTEVVSETAAIETEAASEEATSNA